LNKNKYLYRDIFSPDKSNIGILLKYIFDILFIYCVRKSPLKLKTRKRQSGYFYFQYFSVPGGLSHSQLISNFYKCIHIKLYISIPKFHG